MQAVRPQARDIIVNAFYENVERHLMEHREMAEGEKSENVVLEFRPKPY